ncbi:Hydroxymethylglutaryl-CoA synthase, cytoplasmic [Coccomyxa sp. Obi]|nr:Hydroxymethylglutaryl-CoA synthase, cytoplasmic [Coccomyxa sp. Obi]
MALVERYHTQETRPLAPADIDEPQQSATANAEHGRVVRQAVSLVQSEERAKHVGILALEVYFPDIYVSQEELEVHDKVTKGKYTVGLGQHCMAFCGDQEDVVSMSLTAVHSLLEKYNVDPKSIGRLEVGTESALDRSKSIKTFLMTLFAEHGNHDIEGVDSLNACYGGTAALFNAVNWVESRAWDGRLAIVVAADIAMYAAGPARPSGGCGAIAMLIGPDAPLDLERGLCASHMEHAYDFYKPCGFYPLVDGKSSVACYLMALDRCYASLCEKFERQRRRAKSGNASASSNGGPPSFSLADADFCVLHSPFVKMVRKAFARLVYQDHLRAKSRHQALQDQAERKLSLNRRSSSSSSTPAQQPRPLLAERGPRAQTAADVLVEEEAVRAGAASLDAYPADPDAFAAEGYSDRGLERAAMAASAEAFSRMVQPGLTAAAECGNMYAASVHAGLASLIEAEGAALEGRRVLLYSYGSGLAASLWSLIGRRIEGKFALGSVAAKLDIRGRLAGRRRARPEEFVATLELQERRHAEAGFRPERPLSDLRPGTYYLCEVDGLYRRTYSRKPPTDEPSKSSL